MTTRQPEVTTAALIDAQRVAMAVVGVELAVFFQEQSAQAVPFLNLLASTESEERHLPQLGCSSWGGPCGISKARGQRAP
jgi:hypothetical protein